MQTSLLRRFPHRTRSERGYILLALLFIVTAAAIAALAVYPEVVRQVRRDQEEELIHRGVQYARAVRKFYKKFNRYPNSVDDLVSTDNLRFLRKKYKDPITGKEFKLLHFQDVQLTIAQGGGGPQGAPPGPIAPGARPGAAPINFNPPGGGTGPDQQPGERDGDNQNQNPQGAPSPDNSVPQPTPGTQQAGGNAPAGTGSAGAGQGDQEGDANGQPGSSGSSGSSSAFGSSGFGGGPIVGVVSLSKATTIREFNKKNHYNEWQFIYDPSRDRGGLLNAPVVGGQQGFQPIGGAGVGSNPGGVSSGSGFGSGFGGSPAPVPPQPQPQPNN